IKQYHTLVCFCLWFYLQKRAFDPRRSLFPGGWCTMDERSFASHFPTIERQDPDLFRILVAESRRQQNCLELIASENHVSPAVLEAVGSVLTNKYAEGYPGRR